ncbi:hypothetical protein CBM2633_U10004 [Cupriavidus taiwanensis]|nr:hypothetical protein CBM2633_U10004 [Cupriavidus taiwanensis]
MDVHTDLRRPSERIKGGDQGADMGVDKSCGKVELCTHILGQHRAYVGAATRICGGGWRINWGIAPHMLGPFGSQDTDFAGKKSSLGLLVIVAFL